MPRKRRAKPTDVPGAVLEHFAGPTRRLRRAERHQPSGRRRVYRFFPPAPGTAATCFIHAAI